MKVTFLLPTVELAGGIKVVAIYANALQNMGHTVVLVSPPKRPLTLKSKIRKLILNLFRFPVVRAKVKVVSHLDYFGLDHRVLSSWRPILDADLPDADVVIATWWETAEWMFGLSLAKGTKAYFIQGHEVFPNLPRDRVVATYLTPCYRITISKWLSGVLKREYGWTANAMVENGVDHMQFFAEPRGKQDRPTVGFLFSKSSVKGVDVTLKALQTLKDTLPQLRILSFGSVSPTNEPNWIDCIEFELSPDQSRLREIYAQCDIWVSASRSEGFNLTAMEAMACRTPVIATKTGWPDGAFQNYENGILIEVDDGVSLVDACHNIFLLNDELWRRLSENARNTVSASSWEQSAANFEQALLDCVGGSNRTNVLE
jgi:glycosyltransferase involved in cell wall biosynthesis